MTGYPRTLSRKGAVFLCRVPASHPGGRGQCVSAAEGVSNSLYRGILTPCLHASVKVLGLLLARLLLGLHSEEARWGIITSVSFISSVPRHSGFPEVSH